MGLPIKGRPFGLSGQVNQPIMGSTFPGRTFTRSRIVPLELIVHLDRALVVGHPFGLANSLIALLEELIRVYGLSRAGTLWPVKINLLAPSGASGQPLPPQGLFGQLLQKAREVVESFPSAEGVKLTPGVEIEAKRRLRLRFPVGTNALPVKHRIESVRGVQHVEIVREATLPSRTSTIAPPPFLIAEPIARKASSSSYWAQEMVGRPDKFSAMALENIAILDSGVDITHPALANRVWCTDNESKMDPSGHGTFVAGIIVGEEVFTDPNSATSDTINGMLPASKAWVCTVIDPSGIVLSGGNPTYFVDPGWYSWALNQIIFAREANISSKLGNIQVVNLSLGSSWYSYTEAQDIKRLIDSGCTVVAASGNRSGFIESAMYPSILPGVIAVGAYKYQQSNSLWEWTNWKGVNNSSYIIAPGEGIFSTIPITSNAMGINFSGWSTGTSFATPFVTAMAAAWLFSPPQNGSRLLEGIGVGASSTTWPTLKWNL